MGLFLNNFKEIGPESQRDKNGVNISSYAALIRQEWVVNMKKYFIFILLFSGLIFTNAYSMVEIDYPYIENLKTLNIACSATQIVSWKAGWKCVKSGIDLVISNRPIKEIVYRMCSTAYEHMWQAGYECYMASGVKSVINKCRQDDQHSLKERTACIDSEILHLSIGMNGMQMSKFRKRPQLTFRLKAFLKGCLGAYQGSRGGSDGVKCMSSAIQGVINKLSFNQVIHQMCKLGSSRWAISQCYSDSTQFTLSLTNKNNKIIKYNGPLVSLVKSVEQGCNYFKKQSWKATAKCFNSALNRIIQNKLMAGSVEHICRQGELEAQEARGKCVAVMRSFKGQQGRYPASLSKSSGLSKELGLLRKVCHIVYQDSWRAGGECSSVGLKSIVAGEDIFSTVSKMCHVAHQTSWKAGSNCYINSFEMLNKF